MLLTDPNFTLNAMQTNGRQPQAGLMRACRLTNKNLKSGRGAWGFLGAVGWVPWDGALSLPHPSLPCSHLCAHPCSPSLSLSKGNLKLYCFAGSPGGLPSCSWSGFRVVCFRKNEWGPRTMAAVGDASRWAIPGPDHPYGWKVSVTRWLYCPSSRHRSQITFHTVTCKEQRNKGRLPTFLG